MADINKITEYLEDAIERKVFPGCAVGWVESGKAEIIALGRYTYDENAPAVSEKSLFDCASVTKSIPVSCLVMHFIDRGELGIDDRLTKYVPEYCGAFRDDIRIRHLLTHTLDFDFRLSDYKDLPAEKLLNAVLSADMKCAPGEKFCYANATSILLGMVAETVGGRALHRLAKEIFFDPLGMIDTTFFPSSADNCVPTEIDAWRGREIRGIVHDESAWVLREIMTAGSAGLFSTVGDLLKFVKMLVDGGEPFFSSMMVEAMHTDQIPHISGQRTGLGWELDQGYMGADRSPSVFGKTGFTGTAVMIDRTRKTGIVFLSNYTWPTRKPNRDLINEIRAHVADLVNTGG